MEPGVVLDYKKYCWQNYIMRKSYCIRFIHSDIQIWKMLQDLWIPHTEMERDQMDKCWDMFLPESQEKINTTHWHLLSKYKAKIRRC